MAEACRCARRVDNEASFDPSHLGHMRRLRRRIRLRYPHPHFPSRRSQRSPRRSGQGQHVIRVIWFCCLECFSNALLSANDPRLSVALRRQRSHVRIVSGAPINSIACADCGQHAKIKTHHRLTKKIQALACDRRSSRMRRHRDGEHAPVIPPAPRTGGPSVTSTTPRRRTGGAA